MPGECVFRPGGARPPLSDVDAFIDEHRDEHGVEPICSTLAGAGYLQIDRRPASSQAGLTSLEGFRAVLGARSASPVQGLTVTTHEDAQVKGAVIASAARVVLAVTGDKVARTSSFRFGVAEDVDDLVTTPDVPETALAEFRAAGVRVHLAD